MIYLDNGATSFPKPAGMIEAMRICMASYCGNPGRSGHMMSIKTGEEVYRARRAVAEVFNISSPERIVFGINATSALNQAIKGLLCEGDHAITTAMEHNSVLRPLKTLEVVGVTHTIVSCNCEGVVCTADIEAAVKPETRLIVCTHASNVTGSIQPIKEIGEMVCRINRKRSKQNRIYFLVDGAQSAGCVPIDVVEMKIDMLAMPGHKGLLGPLGTGILYVAEGVPLYPIMEGGTGTDSRDRNQPTGFPDGFESGTVNAPGIIGLGYSVNWVKNIGVSAIKDYEENLIKPLHDALIDMKGVTVYGTKHACDKTAVVCFNITDDQGKIRLGCEETASRLANEYNIAVRGGFHCAGLAHKTIGTWDCGAVRISAGPFNTRKQIKTAINAVYNISRSV
ncbi:MAG: aminotransferase class V-fold PLP-dependent enzyme [Eubacteriales bacterium]|nr:aminotransferase class V-fold PLP-dependent enzyme [Eubacteriales bacterium]